MVPLPTAATVGDWIPWLWLLATLGLLGVRMVFMFIKGVFDTH